ncbi:thaumatin family protein [Streptomyces sp. SID13031]|uniref:thaumatin family protein n=1 Tax=Streptomyces sp. SID13031 TaxID=2706046 RepID=UPI0013C7E8D8|nr:thaumatin family protein [Streptomyces sp. SID13031]NEA30168.1 thaumatin family protein [Streptomyces sp. SID13031]
MPKILAVLLTLALFVALPAPVSATPINAAAVTVHTVTFVNQSGQTLWVGSSVNADNSVNFTGLPRLNNGQSATVTIPEGSWPNHWRGKFFGRQGCTGQSGSTFKCAVGDCGPFADRCSLGEQPTSLAEFNFDQNDGLAPWYNVSYVNAFALPITIRANNPQAPPGSRECETMGCPENLLPYCPQANKRVGTNGVTPYCLNLNRDARTPYSDALSSHCPKAYAWSKQDAEQGNQTVRQCRNCTGFTVTFHAV